MAFSDSSLGSNRGLREIDAGRARRGLVVLAACAIFWIVLGLAAYRFF